MHSLMCVARVNEVQFRIFVRSAPPLDHIAAPVVVVVVGAFSPFRLTDYSNIYNLRLDRHRHRALNCLRT